ncbi:MAG: catalase family protein [Methyloglobulus sp.]|nr:catalase family protein [Methyloglobulus sp.]
MKVQSITLAAIVLKVIKMKIYNPLNLHQNGRFIMDNKFLIICSFILFTQFLCAEVIEQIPIEEKIATQKILGMIEHSVKTEALHGQARRDAHPKSHGCVMAKFSVLASLPKSLKMGIFKELRDYPAWIRFSNGSGKIQDDSEGDGRGMAIKLMGVEKSKSLTQDFVMINHPVFFVRNASDYVEFQQAIIADSPFRFFFPSLNPFKFRLREFWIVNEIKNKDVTNPLDIQYWSQTPYSFGQSAVKYSARSCHKSIPLHESSSPNYLRENMVRQLEKSSACFEFMVQVRNQSTDMPIEDPTIEWSEEMSPFITVARVTIPPQQFNTPKQNELCENLSFSPWHATPEHRPLGGINRVRKVVYETISRVRHEINGQEIIEPTRF